MADEPSPNAVPDAAEDTAVRSATGNRPLGESPLSAQAIEKDAFAERPEAFVGAAFAGGLALALVIRRLAR